MNSRLESGFKSPPKLRGLDFSKKEIRQARINNRMLMLNMETSALCNLSCEFCYSNSGNRLPDELTIKEYQEIIEQAVALGTKVITIAGYGEPLCDRNFWELFDYIQNKGLYAIVFSNNTLITKEVANRLASANVSIIATLNSQVPSTQDKLAGKSGAHKKIYKGLKNLISAGFNKTNPTRLAVDLFMVKDNYSEIPDLFRFARNNNIFPFVCSLLKAGRAKTANLDISNEEFKDMFYQLLDIDEKEFNYSWKPHPPYVASGCKNIYFSLLVNIQGYTRPCYGTMIDLGNIREKSLQELWDSPQLIKIRNIRDYIKGKCRNCQIDEDCYGCRCRTFALTDDPFASDPTCWH